MRRAEDTRVVTLRYSDTVPWDQRIETTQWLYFDTSTRAWCSQFTELLDTGIDRVPWDRRWSHVSTSIPQRQNTRKVPIIKGIPTNTTKNTPMIGSERNPTESTKNANNPPPMIDFASVVPWPNRDQTVTKCQCPNIFTKSKSMYRVLLKIPLPPQQ